MVVAWQNPSFRIKTILLEYPIEYFRKKCLHCIKINSHLIFASNLCDFREVIDFGTLIFSFDFLDRECLISPDHIVHVFCHVKFHQLRNFLDDLIFCVCIKETELITEVQLRLRLMTFLLFLIEIKTWWWVLFSIFSIRFIILLINNYKIKIVKVW